MLKGNMSKILKQAQDMQKKLEEAQSQLGDIIVAAEAGGGMVSVKINGNQEILELTIDEEALDEEKELLEDLIVSAINKGLKKAQEVAASQMKDIMGDLGLPGMLGGQ